jgi:hypothetical protein
MSFGPRDWHRDDHSCCLGSDNPRGASGSSGASFSPAKSGQGLRLQGVRVMTNGWHYAEGKKTVGPLDLKQMQIVLSKVSDPRNLQVWRAGFKDWERAGNVQELAEFIYKPPPLPEPPPLPKPTRLRHKPWAKVLYGLGILVFFMVFADNTVLQLGAMAAIFTLDDLRT